MNTSSEAALGFDQDDAGRWLLQDRRAGQRYPITLGPPPATTRRRGLPLPAAPTGLRVLTDDRLEQVAAVQHGAMHQHATGSDDHARRFAELVTEQRRHRNHPDGFWVASTDPPPPSTP